MKGLFVVFEGIDGTGKTTQVRRLAESLRAQGREAVELREPTDGPHGSEIRRMAIEGRPDPDRERELFVMDRREDVAKNILPSLERGAVVVLDRYYFSTMAYQGARGIDPCEIRAENEAFAPKPDLLVLLDLSVDEALERVRKSRGGAPDEFEQAESLAKVKAIFDGLDDPFILRIDASGTEDAIARMVLARVEELLADHAFKT